MSLSLKAHLLGDGAYLPNPISLPSSTGSTHRFSPALLDRNRLPYSVGRLPNALTNIRSHFEELLTRYTVTSQPPSDRLRVSFLNVADNCENRPHQSESDVSQFAGWICDGPVSVAFREIMEGLHAILDKLEVTTADRAVRTDRTLREILAVLSNASPEEAKGILRVLWEDKSPNTFQRFAAEIQNRINDPDAYGRLEYLNTQQIAWENEEAILGKLAWHSTEEATSPSWAIVFGGTKYFLVYLDHIEDSGDNRRVSLFCSDTLDCRDPALPICSVVLYMMLSDRLSQKELRERLGVTVPSTPKRLDSRIRSSKRGVTTVEAATAQEMEIQVLASGDDGEIFVREGFNGVDCAVGGRARLVVSGRGERGETGTVYRSVGGQLVVKIAHAERSASERVLREAGVYEYLTRKFGGGVGTASFYGVFRSREKIGIIMSDVGESVGSISGLDRWERMSVLRTLWRMHMGGVLHGDFDGRNVVRDCGGVLRIIDFSHSVVDHRCLGVGGCKELMEAGRKAGISREEDWLEVIRGAGIFTRGLDWTRWRVGGVVSGRGIRLAVCVGLIGCIGGWMRWMWR